MPPKPLVGSDEILTAALALVRRDGMERINARSLAEVLGCSTKPLFRLFKNMEELKQALLGRINGYCSAYMLEAPACQGGYVGFALRYIGFAEDEPKLFQALFMDCAITGDFIAHMAMDGEVEDLVRASATGEGLTVDEARGVYQKMWLMAHGIASIAATNSGAFPRPEAQRILADAYRGFVMAAKRGGGA